MENEIFYKNKNTVAILRVSSARQKDGASHDVQEQRTKEYCEEMGLKLVKVFIITESAKKSQDRVKYHNAMEFVNANKCGNIVFYMPDREARNMTDIEENQESVLNGEFNIHYVSERKVLHRDSATTDFMSREFAGLISRDFIRVLRKRVIDAMFA
jgi:predicted site-specific integrase-resolvase